MIEMHISSEVYTDCWLWIVVFHGNLINWCSLFVVNKIRHDNETSNGLRHQLVCLKSSTIPVYTFWETIIWLYITIKLSHIAIYWAAPHVLTKI